MAGRTRKKEAAPARRRKQAPRTAGGNRADAATLDRAERASLEGLRERTEEGHRAAGRTPPSESGARTTKGQSQKVIDTALRDLVVPVTEDEKLLQRPSRERRDFTTT